MNRRFQSGKEPELITAILSGDSQLYHQLIRPYERSVYFMSLSYMKNEKDAEDVAQTTFVRAFRDLWTFQGDSGFNVWLISIAQSEAKNRLGMQTSIQSGSLNESQSEEIPVTPALLLSWRELPSEVIERQEIRALLRQAVAALPDIHRQVFHLHDIEEFYVRDTAQILKINTSSVKVRLHQARMMLQRFLAPQLNTISAASTRCDEPYG